MVLVSDTIEDVNLAVVKAMLPVTVSLAKLCVVMLDLSVGKLALE